MVKNINGKWIAFEDKEENSTSNKCPICGLAYQDTPVISRKDNKTLICQDCSTVEALEATGASDIVINEFKTRIREARKGAKL